MSLPARKGTRRSSATSDLESNFHPCAKDKTQNKATLNKIAD